MRQNAGKKRRVENDRDISNICIARVYQSNRRMHSQVHLGSLRSRCAHHAAVLPSKANLNAWLASGSRYALRNTDLRWKTEKAVQKHQTRGEESAWIEEDVNTTPPAVMQGLCLGCSRPESKGTKDCGAWSVQV